MPSVLLIGDSICLGYGPLVKKYLINKVQVSIIPENCRDSTNLLLHVNEWIINSKADLIHINCGLHDLKFLRDARTYQQPLEIFANNLRSIIEKLQESKKQFAWASITPVIEKRHNAVKEFDRYQHDVEKYNRTASSIMQEEVVGINDLYSVILNDNIGACLMPDGVHMTIHGNHVLAVAVSQFILNYFDI